MTIPRTTAVQFFVAGRPRTKGSLKVISARGRKPLLAEDHAHSGPWRTKIKSAILAQCPGVKLLGPVNVQCVFWFERNGPTAQELPYPVLNAGVNASGDLDKLVRNLLDAAQDVGLIEDDCMVVTLSAAKFWVGLSAPKPGISITVQEIR